MKNMHPKISIVLEQSQTLADVGLCIAWQEDETL